MRSDIVAKPVCYSAVYVAFALLIGLAAVYQPLFALFGCSLLALLATTIHRPELIGYPVLLSTAVSINYVVVLPQGGVEILALYKLGILLLLVPCMAKNGMRLKLAHPLVALSAMLAITFAFADWHPRLTADIALKAFVGLALPFVFLTIRWSREATVRHIRMIALLPVVSVAVGALLQAAHAYSLLDVEFTGAVRVQGANIAPHLAMLAFVAIAVAFIEIKREPERAKFYYATLAVNFAILIATGTRGPLLALAAVAAVWFADTARRFLKGKAQLIVPLVCAIALVGGAGYAQWDNLMKRSYGRETATGIDLSGRAEAWEFFLDRAKDTPYTGLGLGAATVANDGTLYQGFVVPHNEYIRFYFDGGITGAALLFLSLLLVFAAVGRALAPPVRPYYAALVLGFLQYSLSDNTLSTVQFIIPFCWYLNGLYQLAQHHNARKEVIP